MMLNGEWKLSYPGTEYTFGTPATPAWNRTTPDLGDIEIRSADADRPRQDGRAFGIDLRGGRTITFDLGVRSHSEVEVRAEASILARTWRGDAVRQTGGSVAELRAAYGGRERVVYGRPRRFTANYSDVAVNQFVSAVADFACVDDLFYEPELESTPLFGLVPKLGGGLLAPLRAPLSTTLSSDRSMGFTVRSEMPVWPVIDIYGPITNPLIEAVNGFTFDVRAQLNPGDVLRIDTRPWSRSALVNGVTNVAGSVRGTRLSKAALPSGTYEVGVKGIDPTGTAAVRVYWQVSYSSL